MNIINSAPVLIVDDNVMSQKLIAFRLKKEGYETITAKSGQEALDAVANGPVSLIYLDLLMEGMDGHQVLDALQSDEDQKQIPVVVVSGVEDADAAETCIAEGARDFLHKPVNGDVLAQVTVDLIGAPETATAPEVEDASALPIIEPAIIAQMQKDYGAETSANLIARFHDLAPGQRDQIAAASDPEAGRRAAVGLKGGARMLGLFRLASYCREIEMAWVAGDVDRARDATASLDGALDVALEALGGQVG